jgi:hypothetical protein
MQMAAAQVATGSRTATEFSVPGKRLRAELKAVRLTACVIGVCIVLWSPYLIGRLIQVRGVNLLLGQYVADIGNSLIIFNSCINWIIYGLACGDFRRAVKKTLCSSRMGVTSVVPSTTTRLDDNRLGRL